MGGDDSQKLLPWRGIYSSPGRSSLPIHTLQGIATSPQLGTPVYLA
jgi:hypothetical protein